MKMPQLRLDANVCQNQVLKLGHHSALDNAMSNLDVLLMQHIVVGMLLLLILLLLLALTIVQAKAPVIQSLEYAPVQLVGLVQIVPQLLLIVAQTIAVEKVLAIPLMEFVLAQLVGLVQIVVSRS